MDELAESMEADVDAEGDAKEKAADGDGDGEGDSEQVAALEARVTEVRRKLEEQVGRDELDRLVKYLSAEGREGTGASEGESAEDDADEEGEGDDENGDASVAPVPCSFC